MPSKVAADSARRRIERLAAMTPAARVALAMRLGEEGLAAHIALHGGDRRTAGRDIAATRRAGRRRSLCAESR
jgi:hypothetical protein